MTNQRGVLPPDVLSVLTDTPPAGPAVYFLLLADEVVYVGASLMPIGRVETHLSAPSRTFDRTLYLAVADHELAAAEIHWISVLRPRHNKQHNPEPDPAFVGWGDFERHGRDIVPGFAARLIALRREAGLTQAQLAARAGANVTTVVKLEREERAPSLRMAVALAEAIGVSVEDMIPPRKTG